MRVEVVPYDTRWSEQFVEVRSDLLAELESVHVRSIEHVGSTSVPGLAAKARLDIDIVVHLDHVPAASAALEAAGYRALGDLGIADRYAFRAPDRRPPRNVYVVVDGCLALRNHIALREMLRRDERLRDEYGQLKLELARRDYEDIDEYVVGKSLVIQRILAAAGMAPDELAEIDAMNRPSS